MLYRRLCAELAWCHKLVMRTLMMLQSQSMPDKMVRLQAICVPACCWAEGSGQIGPRPQWDFLKC